MVTIGSVAGDDCFVTTEQGPANRDDRFFFRRRKNGNLARKPIWSWFLTSANTCPISYRYRYPFRPVFASKPACTRTWNCTLRDVSYSSVRERSESWGVDQATAHEAGLFWRVWRREFLLAIVPVLFCCWFMIEQFSTDSTGQERLQSPTWMEIRRNLVHKSRVEVLSQNDLL